jgi:hypothetical protein
MDATLASDVFQRSPTSLHLRRRRSLRGALLFKLGFISLSSFGEALKCSGSTSYSFDMADGGGDGWHGGFDSSFVFYKFTLVHITVGTIFFNRSTVGLEQYMTLL